MKTDKKIAIFVVAYNAAQTLVQVLERIPPEIREIICEIFVFDDHSSDQTFLIGKHYKKTNGFEKLNIYRNIKNLGYGGNQKIGYDYAISKNYDFVVLLHGDGQYAPEVLPQLLKPIIDGEAEVVFGSRLMERGKARQGGMPFYKYWGNIILTTFENLMLKMNLSEFHSGYRIYSCQALAKIPYRFNSNDFHFDTEIIIQLKELGVKIKELPIPTYYGNEICYVNGFKYAFNVVKSVLNYKLHQMNLKYVKNFDLGVKRYQAKLSPYSSHQQIVASIPTQQKVLDVGASNGFIAQLLFKKKCTVFGVDIVKTRKPEFFSSYEVIDLDKGLSLTRKEKFDYIILADVLEHLKEPKKILEAIKEYLANDGKIIVSTGNIANWYIRLNLLLGRFDYTSSGILDLSHLRLYTQKTFFNLIEDTGFRIIKKKVTIIPYELALPAWRNSALIRVLNFCSYWLARVWPKLFAYQFIILAELRLDQKQNSPNLLI